MNTRSLKPFFITFVLAGFLMSCGAPAERENYTETAESIRSLTRSLPDSLTNIQARRFLANVQKTLTPLRTEERSVNGLSIIPVSVKKMEPGSISKKIQYLGDVQGDPSVVVYPKLTDIITEIYVENGDYVRQGDLLARINDATVRTSHRQAEAAYYSARSQVANVRVEFERMKKLYDANALSQSQWDQIITQREVAEAGLKQAEAGLELAGTQLDYAELRAPISGFVSNKIYEPGDMATPQKPFASIHQINTVKIPVHVTETDLGSVHIGQTAEITVSAYPDITFEGRVNTISPVIDPMTRTAEVRILADNADLRLKPGMFARTAIITEHRDHALIIDKSAINKQTVLKRFGTGLRDDRVIETYSCYVVRDGIAVYTPIEIGIQSKTEYEVLSGLSAGDLVVIMGQNNLSDSTLVQIVE